MGFIALFGVSVLVDPSLHAPRLHAMHDTLPMRFRIAHVTIQVEQEGQRECESHL